MTACVHIQMSLKFGKYKGKTFEHVYRVDKGYCSWFVNNCSRGKAFKTFILAKGGLFSRASVMGKATTATDLAKKIAFDPVVIEMLGDLLVGDSFECSQEELQEENLEELQDENLEERPGEPQEENLDDPLAARTTPRTRSIATPRRNITAQLYGQFVDFYTRYRISYLLGIPFIDGSVESVIKKKIPGYEIIEKAYDELNGDYNPIEEGIDPDWEEIEGRTHSNVLKCAVASSLSFGSKRDVKALTKGLNLSNEVVKRIDEFIFSVVIQEEPLEESLGGGLEEQCVEPLGKGVLLNPRLSSRMISAYADITTKNGIIDIKTGRDNITYYLSQLMIYAVLFRKKFGVHLKTITIFNPTIEAHTTTIAITQERVDLFEEYLRGLKLL